MGAVSVSNIVSAEGIDEGYQIGGRARKGRRFMQSTTWL